MSAAIVNFAHRGASGYYPENTKAAFAASLALGATGIETDVQMTKDGKLVLIHDESLIRTTGAAGWVKDCTLEELQTLDAGAWFHANYRGETIPTLDELFDIVKGTGVILNLELKNGIVLYPGLEAAVIASIRKHAASERVIVSSFNHYSLVTFKRLAPDIPTGALYMEGLYRPWEYALRIGASALHPEQYAVTAELVAEARAHGIGYNPFTINDPQEMQRFIHMGVAGIITDYPDRLAELLRQGEN